MRGLVRWVVAVSLAVAACAGAHARPGDVPTPPEPIASGTPGGGVVEGHVRRSPDGDVYHDDRFGFSVRGPAGWAAQVNFRDPVTRVVFLEPASRADMACRIAVRMGTHAQLMSGGTHWTAESLEHALEARGEVFYLDRLEHALPIHGTIWTATVYPPDGRRAELGFFFEWSGARAEVVGSFPVDRVSSCKAPLDAVIATLVD